MLLSLDRSMSRRRFSPATEAPLDDEDLLREILLRLAPQPSYLPRSSLVCTRWRRTLSDPQFLRRFREHHRKPPLLGFFAGWDGKSPPVFTPVLDSPDHIPAARFSVPPLSRDSSDQWDFQGFLHGLAVLISRSRLELVVWDPLTGQHHRVSFPTGIPANETIFSWYATVLCADEGHVHGDCFSSPLKLVLMCIGYRQACAFVYDSACGVWGDAVSMATPYALVLSRSNILVGSVVYWLFCVGFLAFDLERQSLAVVDKPADFQGTYDNHWFLRLLRTEDSGLGLAHLARPIIKLWKRESNCDGVVGWVPVQKTIQLEELIPSTMCIDYTSIVIVGYDEDTNQIVLSTSIGNFMLQLDSMQIRHIIKRDKICYQSLYPYANFYTTGIKG